jgi:hypothetical protein
MAVSWVREAIMDEPEVDDYLQPTPPVRPPPRLSADQRRRIENMRFFEFIRAELERQRAERWSQLK